MKFKIFLIVLLLISLVGCENNRVLLIGDSYLLSILKQDNTNSDFLFAKATSQNIYYCLDKNAKSLKSEKHILSLIKKSKKVVISFGIFDLIPLFDFSSKHINYSTEQVDNKLETMDYYFYSSFQIIGEYIDFDKVYLIELINPLTYKFDNLNVFENYIDKVNNMFNDYSKTLGFNILSINNYKNYLLEDFELDSSIKNEILHKKTVH